jgi:hypothetical protein
MMKKAYILMTNINDSDFKGEWDGKEFILREGETKLLPQFLADKFAEIIATDICHKLKRDLISKEEMKELKDKMLGSEIVDVDFPDKTSGDILAEEIEYANNKYLNK